MSIYATMLSFSDSGESEPIAYQGSHVLPLDEDPRHGSVDLALIPGFITRNGRDLNDPDGDKAWPWLRLSVNQESVVLDLQQVGEVYRALGEWLMQVTP